MKATAEHVGVVGRVPALAGLTLQEREAFLLFARERRLAVGGVLFEEGAPGDSLFLVLDGALSVAVKTVGGRRRELSRVTVGEMLGEMACIDPAPRSATVLAVTPAVLAEIDRAGLAAMEQALPRVSAQLVGAVIRLVNERMIDLDGRITAMLAPAEPLAPTAPEAPAAARPELAAPPERRGGWRGFVDRLRGAS